MVEREIKFGDVVFSNALLKVTFLGEFTTGINRYLATHDSGREDKWFCSHKEMLDKANAVK